MMNFTDFIERNPDVLMGKPVIKGTRIGVELLVRKLSSGYSVADLLNAYPNLNEKQIFAALAYAAELIANEITIESV